jgi:hypothetical protein
VRRAAPLVLATVVALALVGCYAALGGGSYKPVAVADPCADRDHAESGGVGGGIEQVVLSALDGAACSLGVSREKLVLALRSESALRDFAQETGVGQDRVEEALRSSLVRAVDDAERNGAIGDGTARVLRSAAERLPIGFVLELIRGAARFLPSQ